MLLFDTAVNANKPELDIRVRVDCGSINLLNQLMPVVNPAPNARVKLGPFTVDTAGKGGSYGGSYPWSCEFSVAAQPRKSGWTDVKTSNDKATSKLEVLPPGVSSAK